MPALTLRERVPSAALALVVLGGGSGASTHDAPLPAEDLVHDYGLVLPGDVVYACFPLPDVAGGPPTVERVRIECTSCLAARSEATDDGTVLHLYLDTHGESGPVEETVLVDLAAPAERTLRVLVRAEIAHPVAARPARLDLGRVPPGQGRTATVALAAWVTLDEERAAALDPEGPWWAADGARLAEVTVLGPTSLRCAAPEERALPLEIVVALDPSAPPGAVRGELVLAFDREGVPELRVPVVATVLPRLSCARATLALGPVPSGTTRSETVELALAGGATAGDVEVEVDDPRFEVAFEAARESAVRYRLDFHADDALGLVRTTLHARLRGAPNESLRIPVFASVTREHAE